MSCTINRVEVWHMTRGGTQICWGLSKNYFPKEPLHFYVDFGRSGTDTWVALNKEPIIDDCCFTDPCQRTWEMLTDAYYRVRMLQPSVPDCPVVKSAPVRANGRLNKKDWLVAREIIRKEQVQARVEDAFGFLLKRKKFGQACPHCRDWDTKEIIDSNCPYCYGVGIIGGYYPGVQYSVTMEANWNRKLNVGQPPQGMHSNIVKQGRVTLYPSIDTKDIWVRGDNDERYIIDSYTVVASYRGLPLIAMATLKLAPATDIVYSVPIEDAPTTPAAEGGDSPAQPCDVRKGLNSSYEDW